MFDNYQKLSDQDCCYHNFVMTAILQLHDI